MAVDKYTPYQGTYTTVNVDITEGGAKPGVEIGFEELGLNTFALNFFQQANTAAAAKFVVNFRGVPDEYRSIFVSAMAEIIGVIEDNNYLKT